VSYKLKPNGKEIGLISNRIAENKVTLKEPTDVKKVAYKVSEQGYSFCPATFFNNSRKQDNFEQMQLLTLDFDGGIPLEKIIERAGQCGLPILFAYETLSSVDKNKFRVLFLNDLPINDKQLAKISLNALMTIFPEADKSCEEIAKMFFGGKSILYFDNSLPTINTEKLLRGMAFYLKESRGDNHYKEHIRRFAMKNGINLNNNGLLDISLITENLPELPGSFPIYIGHGKNSPRPIILCTHGDNFPCPPSITPVWYRIHICRGLTHSSGKEKQPQNHAEYRSSVMAEISPKCRLFSEFTSGKIWLCHNELFGLATNITHVETGLDLFKTALSTYPFYESSWQKNWAYSLKYIRDQGYCKMNCNYFCRYKDFCQHGANILSTVKPKIGTMEKLSGCEEVYAPIEIVQEDVKKKLEQAIESKAIKWHIIKAQTAIGKTEAYLDIMKAYGSLTLIAVPTNKLKKDVYNRAVDKQIGVMMTPSLEELKDLMPDDVWKHIRYLYKTGQHSKVHRYIIKIVKEREIECLDEYLQQKNEIKNYNGHLITTHRMLMNKSEEELKKYSTIIIDEDIILSSIVSDQCKIPISELKKLFDYASNNEAHTELSTKIKRVLKAVKNNILFKIPGFKYDNTSLGKDNKSVNEIPSLYNIPAFCLAEHFMYMKYSEDINNPEGSIVFLKPYNFKKVKYIMVSATADKEICGYCFGKGNIIFQECKYARYKGTLNQYYGKSMSRSCIDANPEILNEIAEGIKIEDMITFKKYNIGAYHFGNAIGCDDLKGKNINVVGTPYKIDFLYKLAAFTFGFQIDADAKMKQCLVRHNGYQYYFTTYGEGHDVLRKIQFWMIESDLEQAVGRARLLRHGCTVNVFSNFPLRQAVMKESFCEQKLAATVKSEKVLPRFTRINYKKKFGKMAFLPLSDPSIKEYSPHSKLNKHCFNAY
jgi:hypothetical protein